MNHLNRLIHAAVLLLYIGLTLNSCNDDNTENRDSLVISTINRLTDNNGGLLTLDDGKTMYPDNSEVLHSYEDGQRAFVIFSQLEEPARGYDYHIHIKKIQKILTKRIVRLDEGELSSEKLGDDKINATYMWISKDKKYLTIEFQYMGTHQVDKKHLLSLAVPDKQTGITAIDNVTDSNDYNDEDSHDFIDLEFRHNSEGDLPERMGEGYVSFRLDKISALMEGKKGLRIRVNTIYKGEQFYKVEFP